MKSGEAASNGPTGGHEAAAAADGSRPGSRSSQLDHLPPHQRPQLSGEVNMSVVFWRKVIRGGSKKSGLAYELITRVVGQLE